MLEVDSIVVPLRRYFERCITVDSTSLGCFRVLLGLAIGWDALFRLVNTHAFYGDAGLAPRSLALQLWNSNARFSFHLMNGSDAFQYALFLCILVLAGLLVLGIANRGVLALLWLLLISAVSRDFFVHQASDVLLCNLIFYGFFLPLNRSPSLRKASGDKSEVSIFSAVYLLFVMSMFVFAGLFKHRSVIWNQGDGVFHAMINDFHGRLWSQWLALHAMPVLKFMDTVIVHWEIWGGFALFFTVGLWRRWVLGGYLLMVASFAVFLRLGEFPFLLLVALVPFAPADFSAWLARPLDALFRQIRSAVGLARLQTETTPRAAGVWALGLQAATVCTALSLMVWNNCQFLGWASPMPFQVAQAANAFNLLEVWSMFAAPAGRDGAVAVVQTRRDGSRWDVFRNRQYNPQQEELEPNRDLPDQRWLKYFAHTAIVYPQQATVAARYFCRYPTEGGAPSEVTIFFTPKVIEGYPRYAQHYQSAVPMGSAVCSIAQ